MTCMAGVRNRLGKRKVCLHVDDVPPLPQCFKLQATDRYVFVFLIKIHIAASHDLQLVIKIR